MDRKQSIEPLCTGGIRAGGRAELATNLDWDTLRIFLAVKRTGSLRGAANKLSVSHATIARGLRVLEEVLGTRLFDRSRTGLSLTVSGEKLVEATERIEAETLGIRRQLTGQDSRPSGRIRVSMPPILAFKFITPLLAAFCRAYPEIHVDLNISNTFLNLNRLETDISIRIAREVEDDVVGRRLIQYKKGIYASPDYIAARPNLAVGDGAEAHWIGWGDSIERPAWLLASPFPKAGLQHSLPEPVIQADAAACGMGLTYLPCFIGDADPGLMRVPGAEPADDRSIWLLLHSDLRRNARVRVFVDFMAEEILRQRPLLRGECPRVHPQPD